MTACLFCLYIVTCLQFSALCMAHGGVPPQCTHTQTFLISPTVNVFHCVFSHSHQIDSSVCSDINHEAFRPVFSTFTVLLVDMSLPLNLKVIEMDSVGDYLN